MAYFTPAELRARYSDLDAATYPDEQIDDVRETAEEAIEHAADVAFEPRTSTAILTRRDRTRLRIPAAKVASVDSITGTDGALDLTGGQLIDPYYTLLTGLPEGPLTVTYTHGYATPPRRVKQAAMILTRAWLIDGPVDDRATSLAVEGGGTVTLATPGMRGAWVGIPEVDATINAYQHRVWVA